MAEHTTLSKNGVTVRLTDERWFHISEGHPEMAGFFFEILETVNDPDLIVEGNYGELICSKSMGNGKHLVAVYRETDGRDGFVITSFLTKRMAALRKRHILWERQK
jgi:hypothetical protein